MANSGKSRIQESRDYFVWLKLAYSSIAKLLLVRLAAHALEFSDGLPQLSNCYRHPGTTGGSPH
jgi:hypothetical protein